MKDRNALRAYFVQKQLTTERSSANQFYGSATKDGQRTASNAGIGKKKKINLNLKAFKQWPKRDKAVSGIYAGT